MPIKSITDNEKLYSYILNRIPRDQRESAFAAYFGDKHPSMVLLRVVDEFDELIRASRLRTNYNKTVTDSFSEADIDMKEIVAKLSDKLEHIDKYDALINWRNDPDFLNALREHAVENYRMHEKAREGRYVFVGMTDEDQVVFYTSWNHAEDDVYNFGDPSHPSWEMELAVPQADVICVPVYFGTYLAVAMSRAALLSDENRDNFGDKVHVQLHQDNDIHKPHPAIVQVLGKVLAMCKPDAVLALVDDEIQNSTELMRTAYPIYLKALENKVVPTEAPTAPPPLPTDIKDPDVPF